MTTDLPSEGQPDYLESVRTEHPRRRRLWAIGAVVLAVAVSAVGGFTLANFLGAGPSPATAVPADAIAYLALDLDPSGGQKVEALKTLRKFPALRETSVVGTTCAGGRGTS